MCAAPGCMSFKRHSHNLILFWYAAALFGFWIGFLVLLCPFGLVHAMLLRIARVLLCAYQRLAFFKFNSIERVVLLYIIVDQHFLKIRKKHLVKSFQRKSFVSGSIKNTPLLFQ